jgi:hypothetical protein
VAQCSRPYGLDCPVSTGSESLIGISDPIERLQIIHSEDGKRAKSAKPEGGESRADYSCGKQTPS